MNGTAGAKRDAPTIRSPVVEATLFPDLDRRGTTEQVALPEVDTEPEQRRGSLLRFDPFGDEPASGRAREMLETDHHGLPSKVDADPAHETDIDTDFVSMGTRCPAQAIAIAE